MDNGISDTFNRLEDIVTAARRLGATGVDVKLATAQGMTASVENGERSGLTVADTLKVGVRVWVGRREGGAVVNSLKPSSLATMIEDAVAAAKGAEASPYNGLPRRNQYAGHMPDVDSFDPTVPTQDELFAQALGLEVAAYGVPHVSKARQTSAGWGTGETFMLTSNGFQGYERSSHSSCGIGVVAEKGNDMQTAGESDVAIYRADLDPVELIGRKAGEKAAARLGAVKPATQRNVTVVLDPDVSDSILGHFISAVSGDNVRFKQTFLADALGTQIFPTGVTIISDPLIRRGLGSSAYDANGLPAKRLTLLRNGVLKSWLLDLESARELRFRAQANAGGGFGGKTSPSPSNLHFKPGLVSPAALMADIEDGVYVTNFMSQGVNLVNGEYSRAASGFRIRNGQIAEPLSQFTLAGNLRDMFGSVVLANDVRPLKVLVPTLRMEGLTLGGA